MGQYFHLGELLLESFSSVLGTNMHSINIKCMLPFSSIFFYFVLTLLLWSVQGKKLLCLSIDFISGIILLKSTDFAIFFSLQESLDIYFTSNKIDHITKQKGYFTAILFRLYD